MIQQKNKRQPSLFFGAFTIWNFMMAHLFLIFGFIFYFKTHSYITFFMFGLLSLTKCFIFSMCLNEYIKSWGNYREN